MRSAGFLWLKYPNPPRLLHWHWNYCVNARVYIGALMTGDMGKIDKSEPCVNISGYAARDGVSKSVTELTTKRQSLNQTVEGVSTA